MTTVTESTPWDFSQVFEFTNAFKPTPFASVAAAAAPDAPALHASGDAPTAPHPTTNGAHDANNTEQGFQSDPAALGDFAKVWQFLGISNPSSANAAPDDSTANFETIKDDYASDGAAYKSGNAQHMPGVHGSDGTDVEESGSVTSTGTPMSKQQRKRARRKERESARAIVSLKSGMVSESEAEHMSRQTPARKASAHVLRAATPTPIRQPTMSSRKAPQQESQQHKNTIIPNDETARQAVEAVARASAAIKNKQPSQTPRSPHTRPREPLTPASKPKQAILQPQVKASRPAALVPASVLPITPDHQQPKKALATLNIATPPPNNGNLPYGLLQQPVNGNVSRSVPPASAPVRRAKPPAAIEPHIIRSGEDRHWALLIKIIGDFYEDRKHLVAPMTLTTHNNDPNGIHLFVDASNIFIGFMNQLKLSRGIHPMHQLPQANLSFDGLALLMERRRPVARRILVGSTPHLPAFDKAKAVGYECNILEKVYKARELTVRQIYFRESDARRFGRPLKMTPGPKAITAAGYSPASVSGNGVAASGSGNTPQFDPPKMIEQGVDEILHLKMLESVVDTERPSTMVLATGDAAAAEYSSGFQAMALRALKKGWRVELISWSKSISSLYTKKDWKETWGDQFRIIFLDDYAEELLDMDVAV